MLQTHLSLRYLQNLAARQPQVAQREQGLDLRRVFRKTPVAHFHETELALDHPERMLDIDVNADLEFLDVLAHRVGGIALGQCSALARAHGHLPPHTCRLLTLHRALIARIGEDDFLLPVQQRMPLGDVVDVRSSPHDGVYRPRAGVQADMGLHAEVRLVGLLGLMHLGISLVFLDLGRTRRGDQAGVLCGARAQHQALGLQELIDRAEHPGCQVVGLPSTSSRRAGVCSMMSKTSVPKAATRRPA